MSDSNLILPQEIYWRHLETVSDIKFTSREMEVVSCICETRLKTKEIAAFLSIAPKTIGTHITNIMGKMDCSSREAISKFPRRKQRGICSLSLSELE
jgi:DNA-binding CsgD family transcriptional regulator